MHAEDDYDMGLTAITDFLADAAPSPKQDGNLQTEPQTASPPKEQNNPGRIIRRRARKACVECHKRYFKTGRDELRY